MGESLNGGLDEHRDFRIKPQRETLLVHGQDARTARLHHQDGRSLAYAEFGQAVNVTGITVDVENLGTFARLQEVEGNQFHEVRDPSGKVGM